MGWHEDVAYENFSGDARTSLLAVRSALCGGGSEGLSPLSRRAWEVFRGVTSAIDDVLDWELRSEVTSRQAISSSTGSERLPLTEVFDLVAVEKFARNRHNWFTAKPTSGGPHLSHLLPAPLDVALTVPQSWQCSCHASRVLLHPDNTADRPAPPLPSAPIVDFVIPGEAIRRGEPIAVGGQGEVWQGKVYSMDVVLKKVRETDKAGRAISAELLRHREAGLVAEADVMRRIQEAPHPNIATYFGCTATVTEEEDGHRPLWVAMEAVKSVYASEPFASSLADWLVRGDPDNDGKPWSVRECQSVAVQICAGLQHLHTHGYLHLDLKPANVLLTRSGASDWSVKVADLGMCLSRTSDGVWVSGYRGTRGYIAPELVACKATRERIEVTESADVYSLGRVLHGVPADAVGGVSQQQLGLLSGRRVPESVREVMDYSLEADPSDRPSVARCVERVNSLFLLFLSVTCCLT